MMEILQRLATAITIISHRKKVSHSNHYKPQSIKSEHSIQIGLTTSNVSYII